MKKETPDYVGGAADLAGWGAGWYAAVRWLKPILYVGVACGLVIMLFAVVAIGCLLLL